MLTAMGFSDRHAAAALTACDGNVERAADWLMSRIDDLDAAVEAALGMCVCVCVFDREGGATLSRRGLLLRPFPRKPTAVQSFCANVHPCTRTRLPGLPDARCLLFPLLAAAAASGAAAPAGAGADACGGASQLLDGPGRYELLAIISHMGQNTACGHYVCHVK